MTTFIEHPQRFRAGTRVLLLKGRHKDGLTKQRSITRITHSTYEFERAMDELLFLCKDGERIYGSAAERDMDRAIRVFRERQLASEYDADPHAFYERLMDRWASALASRGAEKDKVWLFDCDTVEDVGYVQRGLSAYDRPMKPYWYATKSGQHCLVEPFNRVGLSSFANKLIHQNPSILWAY